MKRSGFRHYPNQAEFRKAVLQKYDGVSALTDNPAVDADHVIPKQTLFRWIHPQAKMYEAVQDPRNGIALTRQEHEDRHSGKMKLSKADLESICPEVFEFAEDYDMEWWLDRHMSETK